MNQEELNKHLRTAINASLKAGEKIIEVYNSDFAVEHKDDKSPLTLADKKSHETIDEILSETKIPVLSEEGKNIPYDERKNWQHLWIVDPLDGTKEFVKRNGEFTVNIALIENQKPILGVIYIPMMKVLYFSSKGLGAYKIDLSPLPLSLTRRGVGGEAEELISLSEKLPLKKSLSKFTVVASRSHLSPETENFINELKSKHGEINFVSSGSSIKLCLVAEGSANIYPRFAPTMEWDTAAGQAIAELAGKTVIDYSTKKSMLYNRENLLNNWFLVE
jgi:3'(2'), 5'-bisphosphate nucleotidase